MKKQYHETAVYAACEDVPLETCLPCPYYKPIKGGGKNVHGQPGTCCYCREEAKNYGMTGKANCQK